MNNRRHAITILSLAFLLLAGTTASGTSLRRGQERVGTAVTHETAFAALEPVGDAVGWGRAVVRDETQPDGLHRTVQVWLFGMKSRTKYWIEINGVPIGTILTRSSGSGVLKLQNKGRGHDAVPEELPPAADVEPITVFDLNSAPVLQGTFTKFSKPGGRTIYEEEIALEDVTEVGAAGMAEVEMKEGGHQEFKTLATGLEAGATYSVVVNGSTVAALTTNRQGQARIHLEDPDDDNPIPPELLPVSEIISVEWQDGFGDPVLYGQFTDARVCEHLLGTISMITATGFTLEVEENSISVVTTAETEWEDFDGQLPASGDKVKVEGCWYDDEFLAEVVELKSGNGVAPCVKYLGAITSVSGENFILATDSESIPVVTTGETEWINFEGQSPAVDDVVKVRGCWDGDVFIAEEVKLKTRGHEEKCSNYVGIVTAGAVAEFTLETNKETITVLTTDETEMKHFGDHVLGVGDKVKVKGCWSGDTLMADQLQLIKSAKFRRVN